MRGIVLHPFALLVLATAPTAVAGAPGPPRSLLPPQLGCDVADGRREAAFHAPRRCDNTIELAFRFTRANPVGELWLPFAAYQDLEGTTVYWRFEVRIDGAIGWDDEYGGATIIKTVNEHGIEARQYLSWFTLDRQPIEGRPGTVYVGPSLPSPLLKYRPFNHFSPTMIAARYPRDSFTNPGLNTSRVAAVGLKLDFKKALFGGPITGTLRVTAVTIYPASPAERVQARRLLASQEKKRLAHAARIWAKGVPSRAPVQPSSGFSDVPLIGGRPANAQATSVEETQIRGRNAWRIRARFTRSSTEPEARIARAVFAAAAPVDLQGRTLRTYCAVDPRLQGVLARPNRVRWMLTDSDGNLMEGPAVDVSAGLAATGARIGSPWFQIDISPRADVPIALGSSEPGFAAQVRELQLAFLLGRGAQDLSFVDEPLGGELLCTTPEVGRDADAVRAEAVARDAAAPLVTGVQPKFLADLDALVETAARHGGITLVPVLFDFYAWNGVRDRAVRVWGHDEGGSFVTATSKWSEGEHTEWVRSAAHREALLEHGIRPIVQRLLQLNTTYPGVIRAIDLANEPDNAEAIMNGDDFPAAIELLRRMSDLADEEIRAARTHGMSSPVDTTIGFRRAEDYVRFWQPQIAKWPHPLSLLQVHYYDDFAARDGISLLAKRGVAFSRKAEERTAAFLEQIGPGALFVGEAEGHSVSDYLDATTARRLRGVAFWQLRSVDRNDDGFTVDLSSLRAQFATARARTPRPWIGINLPWLNYGRDFGVDQYEPRRVGVSVPTIRTWLAMLLADLAPPLRPEETSASSRQIVVRVFVGTDWRAGLTYDR